MAILLWRVIQIVFQIMEINSFVAFRPLIIAYLKQNELLMINNGSHCTRKTDKTKNY